MRRLYPALLLLTTLSLVWAQSYRCDWQVLAIGGGTQTGSYRCDATIGQTAIGELTGTLYRMIGGFWYPEPVTGIAEQERFSWPNVTTLETRLYPPLPNPFLRSTQIRYTLNAEQQTLIQVCDLSGRVVRTLVNATQRPGRYTIIWDARDNTGRQVASGIYFCRFSAGDYRQTTKLILQR
ncbi:MAG: T9SS type A sorting domain-containing protein [candidate division WOR-3 bacterium]|jgi:5-hydroxyisourate hydrolase-like protein (transthyretin family)